MNKEKIRIKRKELQGKYSFLKSEGMQNDAMCWGFQCGDGWLPMLEELFDKTDKIAKPYKDFRISTVKEKFGGLRVYCFASTDEIENLIDEYEAKSYKVCERCGRKGKLTHVFGWYVTLCFRHLIARCWRMGRFRGLKQIKSWFKKMED